MCTVAKKGNEWLLQWAGFYDRQLVRLGTDVQLKAETQVRKLEEGLRLEKDMQLFTTLLALGLVTRWESRISWRPYHCHFSKLGRCQMPWVKVQALVTNLIGMLRGRIPGKMRRV